MLRLSTSPEFLQSVIDAQWKWVAQDDEPRIPLAEVFDQWVCLESDEGGFVFVPMGEGVYEVHTLFLPDAQHVLACGREAAQIMFTATDAVRLVTKVPVDNVPADRLTQKMGASLTHIEPAAFLRGGVRQDVKHYALSRDAWLQATEGR